MSKLASRLCVVVLCLGLILVSGRHAAAQTKATAESKSSTEHKSKLDLLTDGMKSADGLFKLWYNDKRLLGLIKSSDLDKEFIVLTSIAQGISRNDVIGGMSWGFDDDVLWVFKKVGDNIHVTRRNVHFTANPGTPEAEAVSMAYSDSVLYALPILTEASGGHVVDLTHAFMNDDQMIGRSIGPSFHFVPDRSTWAKVKAFPDNIELRVAAVYSGMSNLLTVIDPRGAQVQVHYSISRLPASDYTARKADDRVGYFLTVLKNFSDKDDDQHFVRRINRWNLKKETSDGTVSSPVKPIEFYIEKTVPKALRPYVAEGILEWNKAFEKLGFYNAIKVYQPGEYKKREDEIDPEDINYNFFRWITADAGFAMGPFRANPKTGEILDADIIFDDSFLRYWKQEYEVLTPQSVSEIFGYPVEKRNIRKLLEEVQHGTEHGGNHRCAYSKGMQHQMGFAASVLMARGLADEKGKLPEEFIHQALKEVVMHEVGHTLGLRHNFKASTWKDLKQVDDKSKGPNEATVASVMDYNPASITPAGTSQGYYYTPTIGPYDYWAIEYGYKDVGADELAKIASRCTEPALQYATDEDTHPELPILSADPLTNTFDLGSNPIEFAARQMKLSTEVMPKMLDRAVKKGEGYNKARQSFNKLFMEYWRSAVFAARFPGGVYVYRDHNGDPKARPPFQLVDAKQQREGMKLLAERVFAPPTYDPKLLNYLPATHWSHWGIIEPLREDYPIYEYVQMMQAQILFQLINPITFDRLHDNELKTAAGADRYTLAEHLRSIVESVFADWKDVKAGEYTDKAPYIPGFRRNLQRMTLKELAFLVQWSFAGPEDARTLARMHLQNLESQITAALQKKDVKLDDYTRAHLLDSQKRIHQVLNAQLLLQDVD